MENKTGVIYILTNPSFPDYVKIGYADDVDRRLKELNRSECIPFAFRLYAYYEVSARLSDLKIHEMIDKLNPNLRSIEEFDGKTRKREFYAMSAEEAYSILETIATINNLKDNLHLVVPTKEQEDDEKIANEIKELALNRHHLRDIEFYSSLTNKIYYTRTNDKGTLSVFEKDTNIEVPNNSKPSKKQIIRQALIDLGGDVNNNYTLYQLEDRLEKKILGN